MTQVFGGTGVGLPYPQGSNSANFRAFPFSVATNEISLAPGQAFIMPAGEYYANIGKYTSIQYLDPVLNFWRLHTPAGGDSFRHFRTDGVNLRLANLTGCPIAAVVTAGGTGYVQNSTFVTPSAGNSTWQPIVGGQVSTTSFTGGSNYGIAPLLAISAPPAGGIAATAYAVITAGVVSSIVITNVGAGYLSAPTGTFIQSPLDLNTGITPATVVFGLTGAGSLTGLICTNSGIPLAAPNSLTLTVTGTGAAGTCSPLVQQVVSAIGVSGGGAGYGAVVGASSLGGGATPVPAFTNSLIEMSSFMARDVKALLTVAGGIVTGVSKIIDNGIFVSAPTPITVYNAPPTTAATLTYTMGSITDTSLFQLK